ncbi:MAG: diguanylate cyclase [Candidatus Eremiobacteraeota bacterium]|nr:diguanylate cyclase [Candidatus Eremiobacteraeota bacterium]
MKLEQIISKSSMNIAIVALVCGIILMVVAFILKPFAPFSPLLVGIITGIVAFILISSLNRKVGASSRIIMENTRSLVEDSNVQIHDLFEAPEEMETTNKYLKNVSVRVKKAIEELQTEKEVHKKDIERIDEILKIGFSDNDIIFKIKHILEKAVKFCKADGYYLFIKDPDTDSLERINPITGEKSSFNRIDINDPTHKTFINSMDSGIPEYILNMQTGESINENIREWAIKNDIRMLYCLPVYAGNVPYGVLMLSMISRIDFSRGSNALLAIVVDLIGDYYQEEIHIRETIEKYSMLAVENNIIRSVLEARSFEDLCRDLILSISSSLPVDWGGFAVEDEGKEKAYQMVSISLTDPGNTKKSIIPYNKSGIAWVRDNHEIWIEEDLRVSKPFVEDEVYAYADLAARIIAPIYSKDEFVGALTIASCKPAVYNEEHIEMIKKIASMLGDILERSKSIDDLKSNVEELEKSNEGLKKFYNNLGHELRNPLSILNKISHKVKEHSNKLKPEQVSEAFQFISKNTRQLYKSIEDILDYSRAETGKLDFKPREFYLIEILKDIIWEYQEEAKEKKISLRWEIPKGMPEIMADGGMLKSIFREIIGNALKNTDTKGTVTLKANLIPSSWLREKAFEFFPGNIADHLDTGVSHVLISITDTGKGISLNKQKTLFKAPHETPGKIVDEKGRGLGMGLPRVKKLVDAHGGYIWVASKEGKGTRFSFNIPQYGKDWAAFRKFLQDRLNQARTGLYCLSILSISLKDEKRIREQLGENKFIEVLREVDKVIRGTLRTPQDIVQRHYNERNIIVISQSDIGEVHIIKERLQESLKKKLKPGLLPEMPEFEFKSITYPDEVLTADDLMTRLDEQISLESR